jgi:pathogenesis-related protein 1
MRLLIPIAWMLVPAIALAQYPSGYPYPYAYPSQPAPYPPAYRAWTAPPPNNAPGGSLSREMLVAHNAVRAQVGDPPLSWSPRLAAAAQEWAEHLIATAGFYHRPGDRYGENLYTISGGAASPRQVVDAWAAEAQDYDVRSNTCAGVCGHYTQIVWRATRWLGCAVATDPEREVWVCEYDPPGNVVGYRPY